MNIILSIFAVFGLPFFVVKFEKKIKIIEWLSPVVCCYAIGIVLGNLPMIEWDTKLARSLSEVGLMLALPMLLLATDFVAWFKLAKTTIISFGVLIVCVMLVSYLTGVFFKEYDPEVWKMAAMMTGVYIGGTPNLTGIGRILEVRDDVFITLNAVDVALGGMYLLFIMSFGVKLLTVFLKPFNHGEGTQEDISGLGWSHLPTFQKIKNALILIILCGIAVSVSLFLSKLITGEESPAVIILGLTVIALSLSFVQKIRHFKGSQEIGHYFLLVFCVGIGSLANTSNLLGDKMWYFLFCGSVLLGSVSLHFLFCFFLKIDRDTAIITSMAGIFGPAFVPPMSDVLKNKAILVSGITTGLVGFAVGNFAGLIVAWLLK